jgi:hypothetical protein
MRRSIALRRPLVFCATCGMVFIWRISFTKSRASYPLSPCPDHAGFLKDRLHCRSAGLRAPYCGLTISPRHRAQLLPYAGVPKGHDPLGQPAYAGCL